MASAVGPEPLVYNVEEEEKDSQGISTYWAAYIYFIEELRRRFLACPAANCRYFAPVFDVIVRTKSHEITLRILLSCYALGGYKMEGSEGSWLEFGYDEASLPRWPDYGAPPQLIAGSSFLELDYGYIEWGREIGGNRWTMDSVSLGRQELINAVNLLAISNSRRDRAWSLIVVSLMICEGARFDMIASYIAATFHDSLPAPSWLQKLVCYHGSCFVASLDVSNDDPDQYPNLDNDIYLYYCPEEQCLSSDPYLWEDRRILICHDSNVVEDDNLESDPNPDDDDRSDEYGKSIERYVLDGRLEVFSVRIASISGEGSGNFYGNITLNTSRSTQFLYRREIWQPEHVYSGDRILLTGPCESLPTFDRFGIDYALMGYQHPSKDYGFCGHIPWALNDGGVYDEVRHEEIDAMYCKVIVSYIVFRRAVSATVKVSLIGRDGRKRQAHLYGQISVVCEEFDYENILFQKRDLEHVDVAYGGHIELSRPVVSVPGYASLVIRADLYDYGDGGLPFDDEIAKGTVQFPVRGEGTSLKIISGEYSCIRVKVTWEAYVRYM